MWFTVVCTIIDNDTHHHSGQNAETQPSESTTNCDHCDEAYIVVDKSTHRAKPH